MSKYLTKVFSAHSQKLIKTIIKLVKYFLAKFGVGIYRISNAEEKKQKNLSCDFAIKFNSLKNINEFYSSDFDKNYLSKDRLLFYNELIDLSIKKGITFENKNIVDIGCGPGALLNELKKRYQNSRLTGLDFSESAILYAKKKMHGISFEIKDICQQQIDKKYDVIFCTEVLEHLLNPLPFLKKLLTMMTDNGVVILTTPNGRIDNFVGHIHFWSPESWSLFLNDQFPNFKIDTLLMKDGDINLAFISKKS